MKKGLSDFEKECLERQARAREAWGAYAAYVRQNNFNHELKKCRTQEERDRLIKDGERQNSLGFWVG